MNLYHGTSQNYANQIINAVSVSLGGGELGLGFYTTESLAMAVSHGKGMYGQREGKVVKFEIVNDSDFATSNVIHLTHQEVCDTWNKLKSLGEEYIHKFGVDVVSGAICKAPNVTQHKFESDISEDLLNDGAKTVKSIL